MLRKHRLLCLALAVAVTSPGALGATTSATPDNSRLDASLFYQLLVGEMAARTGDSGTGYSVLLDAARKTNDQRLYERAVEVALVARNGDAALEAVQAWARAHPSSQRANLYQFQILVGLNRVAQTVDPLKRQLATLDVPARRELIAQLPRYFVRVSDKAQASAALEKALASELTHPVTGAAAWTSIGLLRMQAENPDLALQALQQAMALDPKAQEPVLVALELAGPSLPAAEPLVQQFLQRSPTADVRMGYARYLINAQRYADAYQQVVSVNAEKPEVPEAWLVRGSLEVQNNQVELAQTSLKRYLSLVGAVASDTPSFSRGATQALLLLSQAAESQGRLDEASAYLDQIGAVEEPLRIQRRRAAILARQGQLEAARELLRATPETQAGDALAKINAEAQLLRDQRRFDLAYDLLKGAMARFPDDADLAYDLAMVAERLNRIDEMETLLRQVIAQNPKHHSAYNALGYSLADRNVRLAEARQFIQQALSFAPDDPYIVDSMGWVEFRDGNHSEALRLLQAAYKARPDAEIAAHLGEVLWTLGQRDAANHVWQEGLALNPQNDTLRQTIQRLRDRP